jgi:hypothetical protein
MSYHININADPYDLAAKHPLQQFPGNKDLEGRESASGP